MADYPEWVMKHKKKGTYINRVGDRYYLYAAHSERVPGTKKVRRVSDGYIGRITEKDGLIPAKDKIQGEPEVFDYGMPATLLFLCGRMRAGFRRSFGANADFVTVSSLLTALYGRSDAATFGKTWFCLRFPNLDPGRVPTAKQTAAIERGARMAADAAKKEFGEGLDDARLELSHVFRAGANGNLYTAGETDAVKEIKRERGIVWENSDE